VEENAIGIEWDGVQLWIGNFADGRIYSYDLNGSVTGAIEVPFYDFPIFTWDGEHFILCDRWTDTPAFHKMDRDGVIVESYFSDLRERVVGLEYVNEHSGGKLWVANGFKDGYGTTDVYRMELRDRWANIVGRISLSGSRENHSYGLVHDGRDLLLGFYNTETMYRLDDLTKEEHWLTLSAEKMTLTPESESEIEVTFDASETYAGTHYAEVVIASNDINQPRISSLAQLRSKGEPEIHIPLSFEGMFTGTYVENQSADDSTSVAGDTVFTRLDSLIQFRWGHGGPLMNYDGFQVYWEGQIFMEEDDWYNFSIKSDDGVLLTIDTTTVIDGWYDGGGWKDGEVFLDAGVHDFRMSYYEKGLEAYVRLYQKTTALGDSVELVPVRPFARTRLTRDSQSQTVVSHFDSVLVERSIINTLRISNVGTDTLDVTEILWDSAGIEVSPTSFFLPAGESRDVRLKFSPSTQGSVVDTLRLLTNDPENPVIRIIMKGYGMFSPLVSASPDTVDQFMDLDSRSTIPFSIMNSGPSELVYSLSLEYFDGTPQLPAPGFYADETRMRGNPGIQQKNALMGRSEPSDFIIRTYNGLPEPTTGMIWVDGSLYLLDYFGGYVSVYDTTTQTTEKLFETHAEPYGLAWDGQHFWVGKYNGNIYGFDSEGEMVGSFSAPFFDYPAIVWDGSSFLLAGINSSVPVVFREGYDGASHQFYKLGEVGPISDMMWVSQHESEELWLVTDEYVDGSLQVRQMTVNGDQMLEVRTHNFGINSWGATLSHDGTDIFLNGWFRDVLYRIEDGIRENEWVVMEEVYQQILPEYKKADHEFELIASTELKSGVHRARIEVQSNDVYMPRFFIPIALRIAGPPYFHVLGRNDRWINFREVPIHQDSTLTLIAANMDASNLDLSFSSVQSFSSEFSFSFSTDSVYSVAPKDEFTVDISYTPVFRSAVSRDTLIVKTSYPGLDTVKIPIEATAVDDESTISVEEDINALPDEFKLYANYPNPFNPTTTIQYDLPQEAFVDISVYDITGRLIRKLVSGVEQAGSKRINWDGTNQKGEAAASGMYFFRMQAMDYEKTKKMILLR
jgi:hypothetical protein